MRSCITLDLFMPGLSPGLRNIYIVVIVQLENDSINVIVSCKRICAPQQVNMEMEYLKINIFIRFLLGTKLTLDR